MRGALTQSLARPRSGSKPGCRRRPSPAPLSHMRLKYSGIAASRVGAPSWLQLARRCVRSNVKRQCELRDCHCYIRWARSRLPYGTNGPSVSVSSRLRGRLRTMAAGCAELQSRIGPLASVCAAQGEQFAASFGRYHWFWRRTTSRQRSPPPTRILPLPFPSGQRANLTHTAEDCLQGALTFRRAIPSPPNSSGQSGGKRTCLGVRAVSRRLESPLCIFKNLRRPAARSYKLSSHDLRKVPLIQSQRQADLLLIEQARSPSYRYCVGHLITGAFTLSPTRSALAVLHI